MVQIIQIVLFWLFLTAILVFVVLMWRTGVQERQKLSQTLIDATLRSTEAAKESAEAVRVLSQKKEHPP